MLSHIFFSMCITSRLCRRSKSFQYSKSHKVDLRVNNNLFSALPRFLFLLPLPGWFPGVICLTFSNSTCNSSAVSLFGASRFSWFALNTYLQYFVGRGSHEFSTLVPCFHLHWLSFQGWKQIHVGISHVTGPRRILFFLPSPRRTQLVPYPVVYLHLAPTNPLWYPGVSNQS